MTKYSVLVAPQVRDDVRQAKRWYKEKSPALPKRFDNEVKAAVNALRLRPLVHAVRYKDVRVAHLKVFPYAVHYKVDNNIILILAVFHSAANPENRTKRT